VILAMSDDDVSKLFSRKRIVRKLAPLVRDLDLLALRGGEDHRMAMAAFERLGLDNRTWCRP
jgi:hypothetical protein